MYSLTNFSLLSWRAEMVNNWMQYICFVFFIVDRAYLWGLRELKLPHLDVELSNSPLSLLLCIPMTARSNLIWLKGDEIYWNHKNPLACGKFRALCCHRPRPFLRRQKGWRGRSSSATLKPLHQNKNLSESPWVQSGCADQYAPADKCVWCINRFFPGFLFQVSNLHWIRILFKKIKLSFYSPNKSGFQILVCLVRYQIREEMILSIINSVHNLTYMTCICICLPLRFLLP